MRFDVITLFPELFGPFLTSGVTRRAFESKLIEVVLWNPRDFAEGNYRRVDDRPFGGGPGMVMMAEPLAACLDAAIAARGAPAPVILFSPVGEALRHAAVQQWAGSEGAVLVCGRYEGVDQRFIDSRVTHQISIGDFVLSGGEPAAICVLDAVVRLLPGALSDHESASGDSHYDGLLSPPSYTRPPEYRGLAVPEVLRSGDHARIDAWRQAEAERLTRERRPDLWEKYKS